jgi:hypothetical protein
MNVRLEGFSFFIALCFFILHVEMEIVKILHGIELILILKLILKLMLMLMLF